MNNNDRRGGGGVTAKGGLFAMHNRQQNFIHIFN